MEKNAKKVFDFYAQNRRMPSFREVMEVTGLRSKNSVAKLIQRMSELDLVKKDPMGKIIPLKKLEALPLLGVVEAGFPSPAEEELRETLTLDEYLIEHREATYMLKVQGDSMIDAGIMPGDMVLVERGITPRTGDIVIAQVDNEWTMKYFKKQGSNIVLMPANKKYLPITATEEMTIAAVVKAVIRKY